MIVTASKAKQSRARSKELDCFVAALLAMTIFLAGCSSAPGDYKSYLQSRNVGMSDEVNIRHCHGYGCQYVSNVQLSQKDWKQIEKIFKPSTKSAEKERKRIAEVIGLFERKVGAADGTDQDIHGTFAKTGKNQLDCVDESTNTTTFLSLLENKGLLKFHSVKGPTMRMPIIHAGRWPHQTAVIQENGSNTLYAVDSWFRDNGAPADIIPLKEWKQGWKPSDVHDLL